MLNTNLTTRLLAVFLALFLWAYVRIARDNFVIHRELSEVPVSTAPTSLPGWTFQLAPNESTVLAQLSGSADRVNSILREEIRVVAEVGPVKKETTRHLPLRVVGLPRGVQGTCIPGEVTVTAKRLEQKQLPVTVAFVTQPQPGAMVGEYLIQPANVTVEGEAEDLALVKHVTVMVDPADPMTSKRTLVPRAVNAQGDRVEDVRVLASTVSVRMSSLTGRERTRQVAVRPPELRNQPRGRTISIARVRPDVVTLSGEAATLDALEGYINTEPIDVRAITKDSQRSVALRVPRGLTVVEGTTVRVDLVVHEN